VIDHDNQKQWLTRINKLLAHHVQDEEKLGEIYDLLCRHIGVATTADQKERKREAIEARMEQS
jgi:hypothetical protein